VSHVFKHPKYYEELRKIAREEKEASSSKQQAIDETVPHCDIEEASSSKPQAEATSVKPQADKVSSRKRQASSPEQQASSDKPQAASSKISEPL
jgi:hypothetical protein